MRWSRVNTEYSIHRVQLTLSAAYTECSIHRVLHTPSTVYPEYCVHCVLHHPKIEPPPPQASLSTLGGPWCTQFSTFPQLRVNQWIESQPASHMPPGPPPPESLPPDWPPSDQLPPDQPPPSTPPILINHGRQVHLWVHWISASVHF